MIEDMQLRNLTAATRKNYLHHAAGFAQYFGRSPEVPLSEPKDPAPLFSTPPGTPESKTHLKSHPQAAV
jgi:hypothetical protein